MAGETIITIIGNVTGDPELRFTASGTAVANFTIASTPRIFDKQANEYKDGETLFMRCSVWREQAENVAETLRKGMRVIAQGALKARSFDTKEGERRTVNELDVEEVGPSMRFATATVNRQQGGNGGGRQSNQQGGNGGGFGGQQSNQQGGFGGGQQGGGQQAGNDWGGSFGGGQQNDPWGQAAPTNGQGGFGSDPGATWN